jgi:hypothetical protein
MDRYLLLEYELEDYNYTPASTDNNGSHIAENYTTPFPMIDTFYELGDGKYPKKLDGFFVPPEQSKYATYMYDRCKRYAEGDHEDRFQAKFKDAWLARFKRAWASFVRDVHFHFMISKFDVFDRQLYDMDIDRKENADLIGWVDNRKYHINLFIGSKNGRKNLERKIKRKNNNAIDIIVPLNPVGFKNNVKTEDGTIWLYSTLHIKAIEDLIYNDKSKTTLPDELTEVMLKNR